MKRPELDLAIRAVYDRQDLSVDSILCQPDLASQFADDVCTEFGEPLPVEEVLHRAISLRKRKGGLPAKPR